MSTNEAAERLPTTKAGRKLWARWNTEALEGARYGFYLDDILAIEAEAGRRAVEWIRRASAEREVSLSPELGERAGLGNIAANTSHRSPRSRLWQRGR